MNRKITVEIVADTSQFDAATDRVLRKAAHLEWMRFGYFLSEFEIWLRRASLESRERAS